MQLTPKEAETLNWLLQGCSNPEIAKYMECSVKTVKHRFHTLFIKHGIEDGVQRSKRVLLAVKAYQQRGKA